MAETVTQPTITRQEHLDWCKHRALEYIEAGRLQEALTSMFSDLGKHPDTQGHPAIQLGVMMMMIGQLKTAEEVTRFIQGFH